MKTKNLLFAGAIALSTVMSPVAALVSSTPIAAASVTAPAKPTGEDAVEHTYQIYQIFTGTVANGNISNAKWGQNAKYTEATKDADGNYKQVPDKVIKALQDVNALDDKAQLETIEEYVDFSSDAVAEIKSGATASGLADGYYIIRDKAKTLDGTKETYTLYITKLGGDITISPKGDKPKLEKKVTDVNDTTAARQAWIDSADHDFGDDVPFKLTASLPSNYAEYVKYKVVFHDKYNSAAFDEPKNIVVKVDDTVIDAANWTQGVDAVEVGYTGFSITIPDLKTFTTNASSKVTVEYTAKLKEEAAVNYTTLNDNNAYLEFSNNPNWDGEGEPETGNTPEDKVRVFTYTLNVDKKNNDGDMLNGATFTLFKKVKNENGTVDKVQKGQIIGLDKHEFKFEGLDDGEYVLEETTAPAGYSKIADIEFEISATHDADSQNPLLTELNVTENLGLSASVNGGVKGDVIDTREGSLPETGGMGTTALYTIGAALVAGAGIAFVTNKRVKRED